jgi:hypothetical protein
MAFDALEFLSRELSKPSEPAKRSNRNRSGRNGRRSYNAYRVLTAVGGTNQHLNAAYGGPDGSDRLEMCVVVDREVHTVVTPGANPPQYKAPQGQWLGRGGAI